MMSHEFSWKKIRKARENDIKDLLPLIAELGYPTHFDKFTKLFNKFTNLDGYGIAVAAKEDKIAGFVAWSKSQLLIADKIRLHIEGIVVGEQYRGHGIGKKLMSFVEEFAKQYGAAIIDLTSGLRRAKDGSHDFYKALGYSNEGHMAKLYLRKEIG
jgi:GNAT superfamily N-acetyltransferase